jgi:DNA-binding transcriptional MocR family regulator
VRWVAELRRADLGAAGIAAAIEARILDGRLPPGEQLPPVRKLALDLSVSATTAASAYQQLRRRGLVVGDGRRGTMVGQASPVVPVYAPVVPAGVRNLADSNPDPVLLPSLTSLAGRLDVPVTLYGARSEVPALVQLVEAWFGADGITGDQVVLVSGGMDGIERVLRAHLRPGDAVVMEDPGYAVLREQLQTMGLRVLPVPVDDEGLLPEPLERALQAGARAVVSTPRAQNPFGCQLTNGRARGLRHVVLNYPSVVLIEDDHGAGLAVPPMASMAAGHSGPWAVVRSPAKLIGPDLRIAFVTGDRVTTTRVRSGFLLGPGWVSNLLQLAALGALREASATQLEARVAGCYAERRMALLDALRSRGVTAFGRSGFNVWLPVPDESAMVTHLLTHGWAVAAGQRFRFAAPPAIRITTARLAAAEAEDLAGLIAATMRPAAAVRHA